MLRKDRRSKEQARGIGNCQELEIINLLLIFGQVIKKDLMEETTSEQRWEECERMNHANI